MGQKHEAVADLPEDAKKRRRVGFFGVDDGVEASECFTIYLVSSKEEVGASENLSIDPVLVSRFFEEDGKIYGYSGLKITVWISMISLHAFADVTYDSTSDGGKGITDLKSALKDIFGDTLVESKDDFLQTFSAEAQFVRSVVSTGEILQQRASSDSNNQLDKANSDIEVIRMVIGKSDAGLLYSRLIPLVFLLVDGSSPIDVTDSSWELYVTVKKTIDHREDVQCNLLGFAAVYRFFHYPDRVRLRLSQILVLPPYQHKGYGRYMLEVLNNVAVAERVHDVTFEEPSDYLQHLRTCIDTLRLLDFEPIKGEIDSAVSRLKQGKLLKKTNTPHLLPPTSAVERVRECLKINKQQFIQCGDILMYLSLDPVDKCTEDLMSIISKRMKDEILGKDSGTSRKQAADVPSDYDPETSFVMFRSKAGEVYSSQVDNKAVQEEQVQELVDERVREIKIIAEKMSLYRSV